MKRYFFSGGIHPDDKKSQSKDQSIINVKPKGDLIYPLSMHIGAPALPVVQKGDHVLAGQKIAEAQGFISAPVYASVSGEVKAIEPRVNVLGNSVMSIIISNDHKFESVEYPPKKPLQEQTKAEILDSIRLAGIVGMGGAGFPSYVKLSPKEPDKIKYVIANCAECEPFITADYRCALEEPTRLINGLRAVLKLFDNAKGFIAVEENKKDCIDKTRDILTGDPDISVVSLKTKYPQGAERMLIYAVTGMAINSSMLPADVGVIVINAETLEAVNEAVTEGKPLINRVITVAGDAVKSPGNFRVPVGMNHIELLEAAGGCDKEPARILSGGPMMGFAMYTIDAPVVKTTSAFLCYGQLQTGIKKPGACINCGKCVSVCPEQLVPARLAHCAERGNKLEFQHWNGMECCECGCCSYVCPAHRQLKQTIGTMRKIILEDRKSESKAK